MLSRTADHLYWMSRYTERAENTARMLDVSWQMSLLPQSEQAAQAAWRAMLEISELTNSFDQKYREVTPANVLSYMTQDMDNPSSIMSCLRAARENARAVRGAMTTDLWETVNATWLDAQRQISQGVLKIAPMDFFEWVKLRSNQSRGVHIGTMMRDEAFHFITLGIFIERADNVARLLDVKFLAASQYMDADLEHVEDFYYWAAILRSLSAFENYRMMYRNAITPERVADLMILSRRNPRSLVACLEQIVELLTRLRNASSARAEHDARALLARFRDMEIEEIFDEGMHDFLGQFLVKINQLALDISEHFLVPLQPSIKSA
ncbi:alpha-E domain-containing protein [Orrella daihaiensis]|uniref:Alpha-E domain-containing protein n=1 Tax=Orrella daihaiensis TaxID=2782176 RepID=A0ABY4AKR6_9BURK|nr:alpha-E domain-containing protein [Orrella daihaiensis]UOD50553.1 alpha-E domain-containing protein [Orrella daihaiensis]